MAAAWETAVAAAQEQQKRSTGAEQRLAWIKAMADYRSVADAAQAQQAAQAAAMQQLAATIVAARTPMATIDPVAANVDADLEGARLVLASVREKLTAQEQLARRLTESVTAAEMAQAALASAEGAMNEAYQKLQARWSERCLAGGLTQLTPEQMARSTWQALGVLDQQRSAAGTEWDAAHPAEGATESPEQRAAAKALFVEQKVYDNLQGNVGTFVSLFGSAPGQPQQVFQATADQALYFANGGELRSWLAPGGGNLTERLIALSDSQAFAEELYLTVYTRSPSTDEVAGLQAYLAGRDQDRPAAIQEIIWALVTSSEFRFGS